MSSIESIATAALSAGDAARPGIAVLGPVLRARGVRRGACLSGDAAPAVLSMTAAAGLDKTLPRCAPQAKLAWVRARQAEGEAVIMVGDGINEAATLAAADASTSARRRRAGASVRWTASVERRRNGLRYTVPRVRPR